jgi:hypothetical protein
MIKASEYFHLRVYFEDEESFNAINNPKATSALFAIEPHDVLPVGILAFSNALGYFPSHE